MQSGIIIMISRELLLEVVFTDLLFGRLTVFEGITVMNIRDPRKHVKNST